MLRFFSCIFLLLWFGYCFADKVVEKNAWVKEALKLQREIDINVPLKEATFIGTHNSYNAANYAIHVLRYIDPNQILSITEQLDAGVRSLEFDAHWTFNRYFSKDILLCHGSQSHIGCSPLDLPFSEGLVELRDWLAANPHEIVLLYIERHLDGHEPQLAAELEKYVGNYIYKPNANHRCQALPGTVTKAAILRAGKQLLIVTKHCHVDKGRYAESTQITEQWNNIVFAGIGEIRDAPFTFLDAKIGSFTPYPDCAAYTVFAHDNHHSSLWRIFEDRTHLANLMSKLPTIESHETHELMQCGINWPAFDMLTVNDPRLDASIWSWAPFYPIVAKGDCVMEVAGVGFENGPCTDMLLGFACINQKTKKIEAIIENGGWQEGYHACASRGKDWIFNVPINGRQMEELADSMREQGLSQVWLNYKRNKGGHWQANLAEKQ